MGEEEEEVIGRGGGGVQGLFKARRHRQAMNEMDAGLDRATPASVRRRVVFSYQNVFSMTMASCACVCVCVCVCSLCVRVRVRVCMMQWSSRTHSSKRTHSVNMAHI